MEETGGGERMKFEMKLSQSDKDVINVTASSDILDIIGKFAKNVLKETVNTGQKTLKKLDVK